MAREKETYRVFIGSYLKDKSSFENYNYFKSSLEKHWQLKIRWVSLENIHLTWKFFGDITQSRINRISKQLNNSIDSLLPMSVLFDSIEIWPKKNSPRQLIWKGTDLQNNITTNFKIIEKALKELGFPPEKRSFKPHITLGRFKIKAKPDYPLEIPPDIKLPPVTMDLKTISIIKSDLLPTGPVYTILENINFN